MLRAAWAVQLGAQPSPVSLAILCAQVALETGNGRACFNHNLGNFKSYGGRNWMMLPTTEYVLGQPIKQRCSFAAFDSLLDGANEYLRQMWSHWTHAWRWLLAGDPEQFAQGLKEQGYYTAPVAQYAAGVRRWFDYYSSRLGGDLDATTPELPPIRGVAPDVTPDAPNTDDDPEAA